MPDSPLFPYFEGQDRVLIPLVVGFAAIAILLVPGRNLTKAAT